MTGPVDTPFVAPPARKVERGPSTQIQRKEKAAGNETLNKLLHFPLMKGNQIPDGIRCRQ